MRYDKTDPRVFASDVRRLAENIEKKLDRRSPTKGTWAQMEKRIDEAADVLWKILRDLDRDQ